MTQICGQGYEGANNIKGDIKGLKTLIMQCKTLRIPFFKIVQI
jgi:hypothetical protein